MTNTGSLARSISAPAASLEQRASLQALLARLEPLAPGRVEELRTRLNAAWLSRTLDVACADGWLLSLTAEVARFETAAAVVVPEGRYAVPTADGHLAFYEVWVAKSNGYRGVSLQISDDFRSLSRSASRAVLAKIASIGALKCAQAYGKEIGCCAMCNRTLTNLKSISRGIGPICASRF